MNQESIAAMHADAVDAARKVEDPAAKARLLAELAPHFWLGPNALFEEAADVARGIADPEQRSTALQTVFERARRS